ncbi:unnamed protein product [Clonostachys byssicola]|uniref:DUF7924 domain-containing protein n=1 Tax=Clonostachys byssicola TaxID=160290 RepID=A0A9N9Y0A2_9HYPO|nr:unnamed protein product [Clonostachys byssicola]
MLICQKSSTAASNRGKKRRVAPFDDLDLLDHERKRSCRSPRLSTPNSPAEEEEAEEVEEEEEDAVTEAGPSSLPFNPVEFWTKQGTWPPPHYSVPNFERILARRYSHSSFVRKALDSNSSTSSSDGKLPNHNAAPYRDPLHPTFFKPANTVMEEAAPKPEITDESESQVRDLLTHEQVFPTGTIFDDGIFAAACRQLENKSHARIVQDISRLIVPSAETLALRDSNLRNLVESVKERWDNSIPATHIIPQPDYSVGFRRDAFSEQQLIKLSPFLGNFLGGDQSYFMSTSYMYFPFLTCQASCGPDALDTAEYHNTHSTAIAVRAVAELFLAVGREREVERKIVAFSVSHDHCCVKIWGYFPVFENGTIKQFRHPIHQFDITAMDGCERWTAYQFAKNVYERWAPGHFETICSAVDQLPQELDVEIFTLRSTGLSQTFDRQNLSQFSNESVRAELCASQSSIPQEPSNTPLTAYTVL